MNQQSQNINTMKFIYSLLAMLAMLLISLPSCTSADYNITISVDMRDAGPIETVGVRGNLKPLSWNKDYTLTDADGDGIYEGTFAISDNKKRLQYKFIKNGTYELRNGDNRKTWIKGEQTIIKSKWEQYDYLDQTALDKLIYTTEQIDEDISILTKTLKAIHPSLYKYQDEDKLGKQLELLRAEMIADPNRANCYAAISKFVATIGCSHTFTNPWNQHSTTESAIFYQPDRLPFTFDRLGKRLFIKHNVSEDASIQSGHELLSINGENVTDVMTALADYIAADGDNYEKRLQRLTIDGLSKFELFDIFYSLVYGSSDRYLITLLDHTTADTISTSVNAIAHSIRTARLYERYADFDADFASNFNYKLLAEGTAYLRLGTFAVFNNDYDWKEFIDKSFEKMTADKVEHLIIDIRGNEGGDAIVAEYVLQYIITSPIETTTAASTTSYIKVPDDIRKYISTWDKRPYDWGNKVEEISPGRYKLKAKYEEGNRSYKPSKKGYRGKSYLLTDATNSSATHLMATYTKLHNLATIVGSPTGGNQKGLNGGYIFFTKLPNTLIEVDIPVFAINVWPDTEATYNGGIQPDVLVERTVSDIVEGGDTVMEATLALINGK